MRRFELGMRIDRDGGDIQGVGLLLFVASPAALRFRGDLYFKAAAARSCSLVELAMRLSRSFFSLAANLAHF